MPLVDVIAWGIVVAALLGLGFIIWSYKDLYTMCPREMWLLFLYKFIEYTAYAWMNMAIILWLSADCGLGDIAAGSYISGWSMMLSLMAMVAGALVDTIGIKKTLYISIVFLLISRFFMSFITDPVVIFVLGFLPLAIGFAIVGPLVSVAIKMFTTKEGAALGFGLFYIVMNIAYAVGGKAFDWFRDVYAQHDAAGKVINENFGAVIFGHHFTTYQLMFVYGFFATCISLVVILFIRDGVEVTEEGVKIEPIQPKGTGLGAIQNAAIKTVQMIKSVMFSKYFWIFMGMLSLTLFVRFIFFHFHYTFPKYGIRVLGEGAKIGNIYGVLNPVMIVYLVPIVAFFTKKVSSYKMMIVGSIVSALSCFIVAIPTVHFEWLTESVLGELIFINWLGMANNMQELMANPPIPDYWPLLLFIFVFTIGEAIWSPRLMQFTAEIAPKGKEGTYIALSVLPFFLAKFFVGPMSGILLNAYTPVDEAQKPLSSYPDHSMIWVWIGATAILTPVGLLLFRKLFNRALDGEEFHDDKNAEADA